MTAIEKLISSCKEICVIGRLCDSSQIVSELRSAVEEYESTPKQWAPPWPLKIPDWPEVWVAVDSNGIGFCYTSEPFAKNGVWRSEDEYGYYQRFASIEIPPGADWRDMKVRVR